MVITRMNWLVVAASVVAILILTPRAIAARGDWTPTLLLTSTDPISDPNVFADRIGNVHVFWGLQRAPSNGGAPITALDYIHRVDGNWSNVVDVYAARTFNRPTGAVDRFGTLHVFWSNGNRLYTGSAPADGLAAAGGWSPPIPVADANLSAAAVGEVSGTLDLVYPGLGSSGVLFRRSEDGARTWSAPTTVSPAGTNLSADWTRLAVGPDGTIHVVWTEFQIPNGWPPSGLFYAHSLDRGQSWSTPIRIAEAGFNQANVVAGQNGLVHVAWNGVAGVLGRYDRWSTDYGITWSDARSLLVPLAGDVDIGGSTGPPGLAIDNSGVVHLLFEEGNRVWHSAWQDGQWSRPDYVSSGDEGGLPALSLGINSKVRHIEQSVMTISLGNELVVVFWDERPGSSRIWSVTKTLAVPASPIQPFAVPIASALPAPVSQPAPTDLVGKLDSGEVGLPPFPVDTRVATMISLVPVLALVVGVIGVRLWLANR